MTDQEILGAAMAYTDKHGGGGGGTTNYNELSNKPQIAGTTLSGNKSLADLGIASATALGDVSNAVTAITDGQTINSFADVETALSGKQNTITAGDDLKFSGSTLNVEVSVPYIDEYDLSTDGNGWTVVTKKHKGEVVSTNTYQSGIYATYDIDGCFTLTCGGSPYWQVALTKASTDDPVGTTYGWSYGETPTVSSISFELAETGTASEFIADLNDALANKQDTLTFDDVPTANSNNPVRSGGVKSAIDTAVASAYHHAGTKTCAELVAGLLVAGNEGNVYNMTDSGTTTADFIEGQGQPIKAGDNVGIAKISDGVYKFDLLSGFVDTTNFVQKSETAGLLKNDGTVDTTIQGDVSTLKSGLTNINSEVDTIKNGIVYGFHIDGSVSDPSNRVTYLRDAIGKTPAYMDYNEGSFNYGSWEDTFFMPRPCMVERSGNVAYYLNPNDYTKKADGTASDIADTAYAGNAMMEWGRDGKKIWMKIEPDSGDTNSCNVYIADHRVDSTFHDWSFHNCNGVSVDHFYTPIYNGSAVSDGTNNVLRSLSGQYISYTQNASTEITMAGRNNAGSAEIWGTEVYADIVLINMLLTLIGKSTNTQGVFGRGLDDGGENAMKAYVTGALNDKGLFFGYNDGSHGVKVFGMENWWACQWRRYRGHIMVDGVQKVKLTYGTEDGSMAAGYNLTGDNYISVGATPTGTSGQYCDKYEFSPNGAFPKDADNTKATASTHYCDGLWFNNSGTRVPFRGGASGNGSHDGAWSVCLGYDASHAGWNIGAALSCKPLA